MAVCKKKRMENTALYLVNELINDVPQPLVWQLQRSRSISICIQTQAQEMCVLNTAGEEYTKYNYPTH